MEKLLTTFRSINNYERYVFLHIIGALIFPGVLAIWIYEPSLVKELSVVKLILLGMTISGPFAFGHYFFIEIFISASNNHEAEKAFSNSMAVALTCSIFSGFTLYAICLFAFIFDTSINVSVFSYVSLNVFVSGLLGYGIKSGIISKNA